VAVIRSSARWIDASSFVGGAVPPHAAVNAIAPAEHNTIRLSTYLRLTAASLE
jgi:hypothetical protein